MGFFGSIFSAAVKTVVSPLAVVKDGLDILDGEEPKATGELLDSIIEDIEDSVK